ncbi:hypothetical protein CCICO_07675 [Corynebacterium ciconiae DSM 44920]|uniref:hypothetical protein n=1 Tax=Corynebacterium ciconiae TaxID=227319 RepID=UPI0012E9EA3E|nr:hypothetical protein [Corynebacterium ciconiae]WKD61555.1 hypothetical protein CCICO_07675 [Corynebacterium ciconiae DSM 44920]
MRSTILAIAALSSAIALSACTPSLEQDSPRKITTPDSDAIPANLPRYIDCVSSPEVRPERISLNCATDSDYVDEITWDEWLIDSASGTATLHTASLSNQTKKRSGSNKAKDTKTDSTKTAKRVAVTLGDPVRTPFGVAFTSLSIDGEEQSP